MNPCYELYCYAVRDQDQAKIDWLTKKRGLLPDIYSDWEDIHSPDLHGMHDPKLVGWQKWLAKKSYLFFPSKVQWLAHDAIKWDDESIVIAIPNAGNAKDKMKLVKDFLLKTASRFDSEANERNPKYALRTMDIVKRYVEWADKASLVHDLKVFDDRREGVPDEHRKYSDEQIEAIIIELKSKNDLGFGWYRSNEGHFDPKDNIAQLKRLSREFKDAIKATTKGIFPGRIEVMPPK